MLMVYGDNRKGGDILWKEMNQSLFRIRVPSRFKLYFRSMPMPINAYSAVC